MRNTQLFNEEVLRLNWKMLRLMILVRDNFRCQNCGYLGKQSLFINYNLTIHHIDGDRQNNKYQNLVTLCDQCHLKAHGGNWKNKPFQPFVPKNMSREVIKRFWKTRGWDYVETEDMDIS